MITIVKQSSYEGYIAIEYEGAMLNLFGGKGNYLNPHEGVIATKLYLKINITIMILSGLEIKKRLGSDIYIDLNENQLNPNSYNLKLHNN